MKTASTLLLGFCLLLPTACERAAPPVSSTARSDEARNTLEKLLQHMRQRLDVMHDVARTKWNTQRPIHDPERERLLLEDIATQAQARGLDRSFARSFFAAQMEAARWIQEDDFQKWRTTNQGPFSETPDLSTLRQRIDAINRELLAALVPARPDLDTPEGRQELHRLAERLLADIPAPARDAALWPFAQPAPTP
jgi:chorismate mutase